MAKSQRMGQSGGGVISLKDGGRQEEEQGQLISKEKKN